ncbi:MAG: Crp/Fnr family transcriptional regulator [Bacteroidetes bacterium]|nr:Crp/Fnr family transcriptional regulator [Bacteroidota bacterium]
MVANIRPHIEKHIRLTDEEFDYFISLTKHRKIRKRQYILQAGDVCLYESYVIGGCLRTYYVDDKGLEHILQFAIEDWWVGDILSFLSNTPAKYNIDALEDTELLQIDNSSIEKLYKKVPQFERFFRIKIQNAFIQLQQRIIASMSETAEQRYIHFVEKYPQLEQRLPQHQVASYLGITPEFLSRIRKNIATGK